MPSSKLFYLSFRLSVLCLLGGVLALGLGAPPTLHAQSLPLYTVATNDDQLRTIDPLTGATLTMVTITLTGETIDGANGLALHPLTGELFALLRPAFAGGLPAPRELVILDPATGVATRIGSTGDGFAGITFDASGTLYGITGDGAAIPETLWTLSTTTGAPTFVLALGNGNDGEAIAFNPNDGLIYHLSGINFLNDGRIFESIDPNTLTVTNIPLSVDQHEEVTALTHFVGNIFLIGNRSPEQLFLITTNGRVRAMEALDHRPKGLVFAGPPPTCPLLAELYGAANQGQDGPSLFYTIDSATGAPTLVGPMGFERVSAMAFDAAGTLFANGERMDGSDVNVLLTVDPCTGLGTEVGPTNIEALLGRPFGEVTLRDISFRNSDGVLFGNISDVGTATISILTLDPETGAASAVGATGTIVNPAGAMAFSPGDVLFITATGGTGDQLFTLDQTTATAMLVVPLVFSPPADNNPRHNAMDFEPGTGVLFGSLNDGFGGLPENHLSTIDTTTGVVTVLGPTQDGLDALAFTSVSDFDVSASPASQTVARGQAATYTASVNPIFGTFNNPVSLACGSLPTGVSCSFSPGTVTPGASPANSTLTVDTSGLATLG
ncbi:MAG: hypothetical protein V3S55_03405, partial [Nitrospiraceae bacterium]